MAARWPDCRRHTEILIESVFPNGQITQGRIDPLLEVPDGWVVLDNKANPASRGKWDEVATEHSGQLSKFVDALTRATGRSVTETWLMLPVTAGAVRITMSMP